MSKRSQRRAEWLRKVAKKERREAASPPAIDPGPRLTAWARPVVI
jgi:hypothetical protein